MAVLGLARLHQGDGFYLVAWDGDEPLGHVYLALTDPPELHDVSVRTEHRRRGVASALIAAAEREIRARVCDRLRIAVSIDNQSAQALYRACGYVDAGLPPKRVKGNRDPHRANRGRRHAADLGEAARPSTMIVAVARGGSGGTRSTRSSSPAR